MAIKDYKAAAQQIIQLSGGAENFKTVENCATRVRIQYKDISKVDIDSIKNMDGVINVVLQGALQIIVGPGVCNKLCDELNRQLPIAVTDGEIEEDGKKDNPLKILSDIFVPTLPAMIAAGVVQGLNNILKSIAASQAAKAGILATETLTAAEVWMQQTHLFGLSSVMGLMYAAVFNFLGAYVGFTAAKRLKVEPVLGAMIGLITLQPGLAALGVASGQGGLIGVILGVLLLKYVIQLMRKIIPDQVAVIFVPTLSVLIVAMALVYILMPFCGVLSTAVVNFLMFILDKTGIFGGFVLAALFPTLISTGLHHGLAAIHMEMLNTLGKAPLISVQVMSNAGMVGAACGIYLLVRNKNKKIQEACEGAIPTSFLCVGEPVIYGVCLPSGFGFITGSIGAGVGGALIRLFDVSFSAMGMAGMSALPLVADNKYIYYLISYFCGAAVACALTYFVGKSRNYGQEDAVIEAEDVKEIVMDDNTEIVSVVDGQLIDVTTVSDQVFSQKMMGDGVAFTVDEDTMDVCAPASGKLSVMFPTGHAFGVTMSNGVELLVHIGIDTVEANGDGFTTHKKQDDIVQAGDPIVTVDFKKLKEKYDMSIILIATNPNGKTITFAKPQAVNKGQSVAELV